MIPFLLCGGGKIGLTSLGLRQSAPINNHPDCGGTLHRILMQVYQTLLFPPPHKRKVAVWLRETKLRHVSEMCHSPVMETSCCPSKGWLLFINLIWIGIPLVRLSRGSSLNKNARRQLGEGVVSILSQESRAPLWTIN